MAQIMLSEGEIREAIMKLVEEKYGVTAVGNILHLTPSMIDGKYVGCIYEYEKPKEKVSQSEQVEHVEGKE